MGKRRKPIQLYVKILLGMILGIGFGVLAVHLGFVEVVRDWIKPFGEIFMRLLKLIAVPLIVVSLIKGVGNLTDITSLSKLGVKTLGVYIGTTILAILAGLFFVELISPGEYVSADSVSHLQVQYQSSVESQAAAAGELSAVSPLKPLVDVIPENALGAMATNGNMLQVIFIAILVGVAILLVGRDTARPVMSLVESLDVIILKIVSVIMLYSPIGVFALMAAMVCDSAGNVSLLGALGMYCLTVVAGLLSLVFVIYPLLLRVFTRVPVMRFFRAMSPVQLLALTTSSSAVTLPLTMEAATKKLDISERTASFVLPVGVTINMDGTSCYQIVAAVFIAQVLGIDLGWQELMILIATTTISSIGTPGIPGGSVVILVMVLGSVGIPAEGLALILGLDRPLDMLRTVVNVTGDVTVASIVDRE